MESVLLFVVVLFFMFLVFVGIFDKRTKRYSSSSLFDPPVETFGLAPERAYNLRVYLQVLYQEKDQVKDLGAKWDAQRKQWYILGGNDLKQFHHWLPMLYAELIPEPLFNKNLRAILKEDEWRSIKKANFEKSGGKCVICFKQGDQRSIECHEVWEYDDSNLVQKLAGFDSLCSDCHAAKHVGHAIHTKSLEASLEIFRHIGRVNNWKMSQIINHINDNFRINRYRNEFSWRQDLGQYNLD